MIKICKVKIKLSIILFISLFITSCGGGKIAVGSETANKNLSSKDIIKSHDEALPQEVMNKEMNNMILSLIFTLQILIIHRLIGNR